jgi:hypothetical protein
VPNFLFLAMRFILANVTQNYNATRWSQLGGVFRQTSQNNNIL